MNNRQRLVVLLMNILIFVELTFSIIQGKQDLENMTAVFFINFIPLFLITFIITKILVRRLESVEIPAPVLSESQIDNRLESRHGSNQ